MKKFLPLLIGVCVFPFALLCGCYILTDDIMGDTYTKIYGIKMGIECDDTTVKATDDVYYLSTGSTYTMEISLIQGGGSTPSGICGDCITFECSGNVNIVYAGDDTDEGDVIYSMYGTKAETSVVTAHFGNYSCLATLIFLKTNNI